MKEKWCKKALFLLWMCGKKNGVKKPYSSYGCVGKKNYGPAWAATVWFERLRYKVHYVFSLSKIKYSLQGIVAQVLYEFSTSSINTSEFYCTLWNVDDLAFYF